MEMVEGAKVVNIMADGSICEDLSTYELKEPLPDYVLRLFYDFMVQGRKIRERQERQANNEKLDE